MAKKVINEAMIGTIKRRRIELKRGFEGLPAGGSDESSIG
jgi:hypothetical protein